MYYIALFFYIIPYCPQSRKVILKKNTQPPFSFIQIVRNQGKMKVQPVFFCGLSLSIEKNWPKSVGWEARTICVSFHWAKKIWIICLTFQWTCFYIQKHVMQFHFNACVCLNATLINAPGNPVDFEWHSFHKEHNCIRIEIKILSYE